MNTFVDVIYRRHASQLWVVYQEVIIVVGHWNSV